jgi:hypothetical protein
MLSLPIPSRQAPLSYGDLRFDDGTSIGPLVNDLTRGRIPAHYRAHLDPDLNTASIHRPPGWRPLFGQADAAARHLIRQGVGVGDLFLFFGWFRPAECHAGTWRYVPRSASFHAIFGWLNVGEHHDVDAAPNDVRARAGRHPHFSGLEAKTNHVFVAADRYRIAGRSLPGGGVFRFAPHRVLTEAGGNRSTWLLPAWMHPSRGVAELSYNRKPGLWEAVDDLRCRVRVASKGQEFVLTGARAADVQSWLVKVFGELDED